MNCWLRVESYQGSQTGMTNSPEASKASTSAKQTLRKAAIFLALLQSAFSRKAVSSRSKAGRQAGGRAFRRGFFGGWSWNI